MFEDKYQRMLLIFSGKFPAVFNAIFPYRKVIKFIFSGGAAAFVTLLTLYFFTAIVGLWYVVSSVIGYVAGFGVSFTLQKFWAFRDKSTKKIERQAFFYGLTIVANLILNTYGIYFFVQYLDFNYLVAQIIVGLLIACASFFIYRDFIFKKPKFTSNPEV